MVICLTHGEGKGEGVGGRLSKTRRRGKRQKVVSYSSKPPSTITQFTKLKPAIILESLFEELPCQEVMTVFKDIERTDILHKYRYTRISMKSNTLALLLTLVHS